MHSFLATVSAYLRREISMLAFAQLRNSLDGSHIQSIHFNWQTNTNDEVHAARDN